MYRKHISKILSCVEQTRPLLLFLILIPLWSGCQGELDEQELSALLQGDVTRGGALYDKWWQVAGVREGIEPGGSIQLSGGQTVLSSLPANNPMYMAMANGGSPSRSGSQTWRCKECHGWDYQGQSGAYGSGSHYTGFSGIYASRGKSFEELFKSIRDDHGYGQVFSDNDMVDMVKFIREGLIDTNGYIDLVTKLAKGNSGNGTSDYNGNCAACHGSDGQEINFKEGSYDSEFLADLALGNPWELMHKIRFGQPGGSMPTAADKGYLLSDVTDIMAYVQVLGSSDGELNGASVPRGGALWDNWWEINGASEPGATNSLYQDPTYNTAGGAKTGSATWRCKECHGWDYQGADGAYAAGSHATGIKGVLDAEEKTVAVLFESIKNGVFTGSDGTTVTDTQASHAFGGASLLSDADIYDLVRFIREGLCDAQDYISPATNIGEGSVVSGQGLFTSNCSVCHGSRGTTINFKISAPEDRTCTGLQYDGVQVEYVGGLARDNPWELMHKIRFGQPGSSEYDSGDPGHMPNMFDLGYTLAEVSNLVAFCQTISSSTDRGGTLWDKWWEIEDVAEPIEPGGSITDSTGAEVQSSLLASNAYYTGNACEVPDGSGGCTALNDRTGSQTWRCKECHGWDYKGVDGAYGSGSHQSGFAGVLIAQGDSDEDIYRAIACGTNTPDPANHAFLEIIGENGVRDLVNLIQESILDEDQFIDSADKTVLETYVAVSMPDRSRDAESVMGQIRFNMNCANCHGADGMAINFKAPSGVEYLGDLARGNPWELMHKILYGHSGSSPRMPMANEKYYTLDDVADIMLYSQQLP